jgi:phospholipid/cholesterol/gamma-HCH transport system permease protein
MTRASVSMPDPSLSPPQSSIAVSGDGNHLALAGALEIATLETLRNLLPNWSRKGRSRTLDLSRLESIDTPGALYLCGLRDKGVELTAVRPDHQALLDLIGGLDLKPWPKAATVARWRHAIEQVGKYSRTIRSETRDLLTFLGRVASWTARSLLHPSSLRPASISRHIAETGIQALPIIGLMAVMIAVVIGYQGVAQLRPFGGEGYTINLVAVSVLREMGVLITAIMVAGRSGSAFCAEIGIMKTREEIDLWQISLRQRQYLQRHPQPGLRQRWP